MPVPPFENHLCLKLLGGFDVQMNGQSIGGFNYKRMRALLAYLAIGHTRDHSREYLLGLLWPSFSPEAGANNLRRTLSDLRRALEGPSGVTLIHANRASVRFTPNLMIDALDFLGFAKAPAGPHGIDPSDIARALALYRGEFMAGFSLPECPEFEGWLHMQRATLQRTALTLLEQQANRWEQAGDYSQSLQYALRHLELDGWNENAHRRVIRLYVLNGQDSAAMAQYQTLSQLLKQEFGAFPSDETHALVKHIGNGSMGSAMRAMSPANIQNPTLQRSRLRRQITALYCEFSVATDDLDEAVALIDAPQACCMEIVHRFSGHTVQTHGGGLLAYFGYPFAREDAARCAVRAALAIASAKHAGVDIHASVHTGMVIANADAAIPDKTGMTSRLVIQLRHHTDPGEVIISSDTYMLVNGYFKCIRKGLYALPASTQPLELFQVLEPIDANTHWEAGKYMPPTVGRHAEIAKLLALWQQAAQGKRQVALLQGDAGIGKSRVVFALKARLADQAIAIYEARCFSEFSTSPFHPLIALLGTVFELAPGDAVEMKSTKVARHLAAYRPALGKETIALIVELLTQSHETQRPALALSPRKHRERTMSALLEVFAVFSAQQPVLLVVEDLHWADPSTVEWLWLWVSVQREGSIFTLLTARPSFDPPWDEVLETNIMLAPLADDEIQALVTSLHANLSPAALGQIVQRADGVPLFAEELTTLFANNSAQNIPSTLHDLLAERIDGLGDAKRAAQIAATLGRDFNIDLLCKAMSVESAELLQMVRVAEDAGLVLRTGERQSQFRHALIQEAAYESQTKSDRQAAHRSIALALQNDFPSIAIQNPEMVAQHCIAGGDALQAIQYWLLAAQRVPLQAASKETLAYIKAGIQALDALPSGIERDRLEFSLQVRQGFALQALYGFAHAPGLDALNRAIVLSKKIGNTKGLFQALLNLAIGTSSLQDKGHKDSLVLGLHLLEIAQESADPQLLQQAHHFVGNMLFWMGRFGEARLHQEMAIACDPERHEDIQADESGRIVSVISQGYLSCIYWMQGFKEQAHALSRTSIQRARQFDQAHTLAYTLVIGATMHRWDDKPEVVLELASESLLVAQKADLVLWQLSSKLLRGWALARLNSAEGIAEIEQCVSQIRSVMGGIVLSFTVPYADALLHQRQADSALGVIDESLAEVDRKNDHHLEAELHRLKGEALRQSNRHDEARASFRRALELSRQQGAKSHELRVMESLKRAE